jgi:hypothetical protein
MEFKIIPKSDPNFASRILLRDRKYPSEAGLDWKWRFQNGFKLLDTEGAI